MRRAARRFAEEQRRLGRWDTKGPLVETEPPRGNHGMNERLEIAGEWKGAILRDRRRESHVSGEREASNTAEPPRLPDSRASERSDQSDTLSSMED